ncbi:ABC transporter permease [Thiobacter aerophilum]|uniref:FtsX-like permease family protein n=1 Tax=Thiobacter aerophilum TaxID=3121275 RepID=A0ABV0EH57_9BURK
MLLKLILKNVFRHRLRSGLTLLGVTVAVLAFGLLQTVVGAWYAAAEATSMSRLVTRNAISLVFPLPLSYLQKIRAVPGVTQVSHSNWFGGVYVSERNFFPQFAVDAASYFRLYPEFIVQPAQMQAFLRDRQGAVVGRKLAQRFGWRLGDTVSLRGTIWPGTWRFTIRGIYRGAEASTDEGLFFFHWAYLNETAKRNFPRRANTVGVFIVGIDDASRAAAISNALDALFRNSLAETRTETEKAFQLSFVSMTEAILLAIQTVSYVVIVIILAVMANTMAMSARERLAEYATLKALGFGPGFVRLLVYGESLAIALLGGAMAMALTFPASDAFGRQLASLFPVFRVQPQTLGLQALAALLVGFIAALVPAEKGARVNIVAGLRSIG